MRFSLRMVYACVHVYGRLRQEWSYCWAIHQSTLELFCTRSLRLSPSTSGSRVEYSLMSDHVCARWSANAEEVTAGVGLLSNIASLHSKQPRSQLTPTGPFPLEVWILIFDTLLNDAADLDSTTKSASAFASTFTHTIKPKPHRLILHPNIPTLHHLTTLSSPLRTTLTPFLYASAHFCLSFSSIHTIPHIPPRYLPHIRHLKHHLPTPAPSPTTQLACRTNDSRMPLPSCGLKSFFTALHTLGVVDRLYTLTIAFDTLPLGAHRIMRGEYRGGAMVVRASNRAHLEEQGLAGWVALILEAVMEYFGSVGTEERKDEGEEGQGGWSVEEHLIWEMRDMAEYGLSLVACVHGEMEVRFRKVGKGETGEGGGGRCLRCM